MTYVERLAEFVKVTGHKPGEMNKIREPHVREPLPGVSPLTWGAEPPAQSAGPGRCNRYGKVARGFAAPCVLDAGHKGAHEL